MSVGYVDRRHTQTQEQYAANDLETMQGATRYAAHLFGLFRPYIGKRVLEVGCGIGTMSERLTEVADLVLGIEPNPACAGQLRERMANHPTFSFRECLLEDCDQGELTSHRFDTVFCVNVLEHIQDDVAALDTFKHIVEPGGRVLVWVPAVPAAYGPLDAELGHYRRYTKRSLADAFSGAGLGLVSLRYTNPLGLLGWMYNARISKSTSHSPTQVKLFETLVAPWALPLERLVRPPVGLSLVAVGKRSR